MKTSNRESGSGLILIIGVIAALAVLAAMTVMLLANVQANTSRDRAQKTSFTVSEAAVDAALAQLSAAWPAGDATFDSSFLQPYLDELPAAGYPTPPPPIVEFYDNTGAGGTLGTDAWDKDGDGRLWVEATATTIKRTTRVRVLVERVMVNLGLLDNIAVWTPGMLDSQSAASSVSYEVLGPGATRAIVEYNTLASGSRPFDPLTVKEITPATDANLLISPELLGYFRAEAERVNRVGEAKLYTSLPNGTNFTGLVYLDSGAASSSRQLPATQNVDLGTGGGSSLVLNGDGVGANAKPGVLIFDAKDVNLTGNVDFYGLIYCSGAIKIASGIRIHGMVLAGNINVPVGTRAVTLLGTQNVLYNNNVRANLDRQYSISVHMVANTWRELGPTPVL